MPIAKVRDTRPMMSLAKASAARSFAGCLWRRSAFLVPIPRACPFPSAAAWLIPLDASLPQPPAFDSGSAAQERAWSSAHLDCHEARTGDAVETSSVRFSALREIVRHL